MYCSLVLCVIFRIEVAFNLDSHRRSLSVASVVLTWALLLIQACPIPALARMTSDMPSACMHRTAQALG